MNKAELESFRDLIDLWPEAADEPAKAGFAADLGITPVHAQNMHRRNSVPPKHWDDVLAAAVKRGIAGITKEVLADLAMARDLERQAS